MAASGHEHGFIESGDGTSIYFESDVPRDFEGTSVLIFHGFGEHCGRYGHVVARLREAGFACFRFDFRGHGRSAGQRGHVSRFDDYLADGEAALSALRARRTAGPIYLLGHSQGGLVATAFLLERSAELAGAVISSPLLGFSVKVPKWKDLVGRGLSKLIPKLSMPTDLDADVLSHDSDVVTAYQEDPLVHGVASSRWYTESLAAQQRVMENAARINIPLLLLQAGDDRLVDAEQTARFAEVVGSEDNTFHLYENLYHEILNEPEGPSIIQTIVDWITTRAHSAAA